NQMPPWGGTDLLLSTNPLAAAIPAGNGTPVVMDFATTVASMGRIRTVAQRGEAMPEGWMVARDGTPLTDPARAPEGLLLPMGGYKGYALALVIGLLAGTLNGAAMGGDLIDYIADNDRAANTGQFICALDPAAFGDPAAIGSAVDRVAGEMRGSATMPGVDSVLVPGDGRAARLADRAANGIPIPDALRATLDGIAEETEVAPLGS
ncbi:MAG: Ldh family oxidoreductase, partial [Defluviicoccus sp.]|nr:Ldh family oxidoreductase [Defluviicoccus sp.]